MDMRPDAKPDDDHSIIQEDSDLDDDFRQLEMSQAMLNNEEDSEDDGGEALKLLLAQHEARQSEARTVPAVLRSGKTESQVEGILHNYESRR